MLVNHKSYFTYPSDIFRPNDGKSGLTQKIRTYSPSRIYNHPCLGSVIHTNTGHFMRTHTLGTFFGGKVKTLQAALEQRNDSFHGDYMGVLCGFCCNFLKW